jgi:hypothetical protein
MGLTPDQGMFVLLFLKKHKHPIIFYEQDHQIGSGLARVDHSWRCHAVCLTSLGYDYSRKMNAWEPKVHVQKNNNSMQKTTDLLK